MKALAFWVLLFAFSSWATVVQWRVGVLSDGSYLAPTGQRLTPAGTHIEVGERPLGMALSPDGATLAVLTSSSFAACYVHLVSAATHTITQTFPVEASFAGIAFNADGTQLYAGGGTAQKVFSFTRQANGAFAADSALSIPGSEPSGLSVHPSTGRVFVALNAAHEVAVMDPAAKNIIKQIPVGAYPYTTLVSLDGKSVYVTNWGGRKPLAGDATDGVAPVVVNPATGIANNGSVSVIDAATLTVRKEIQVGLHPSAMALSPGGEHLYVANANSDTVSVIDTSLDQVIGEIDVRPFAGAPPGSAPNALAVSPDGATLYVANGGNNAIAMVDLTAPAVKGFIPAGWFPAALAVSRDGGTIFAASAYGFGSVAAAGEGRTFANRTGVLSFIPVPDAATLDAHTLSVAHNNGRAFRDAAPALAGGTAPIQHVFYVIKENRTYDQVLGDLAQANGDANLTLFGANVTPNHHALAEQFVLLDNYYAAGDQSSLGHQWCDEAYANDYVHKYGNARNDFAGTNPMAYSPGGFIWDHARAFGRKVKVYGEFASQQTKTPAMTWTAAFQDWKSGVSALRISAGTRVAGLKPLLATNYPGFDLAVPDQVRAQLFIANFQQMLKAGTVPNLVILSLPADHTVGTNPGYPTPRAMVADNDAALGRIVEAISNSSIWASSAIFVTEDDAQDGTDHVDGHRTVGLVASPWVRHGAVNSTVFTTIGMLATIEQLLGLPPMTQFDMQARPMSALFTDQPDMTPYVARAPNIALDEMNPAISATTGLARKYALASQKMNLSEPDAAPEDVLNRAIWHSVKGYEKKYPGD